MGDEKKQAQITKLQLDIDAIKRKQAKLVNEKKAYCSTVISKFGESIKHMAGVFSAGFEESEGLLSDIFVIGQNIDINGYYGAANDTGVYSITSTGAYNNNNETKNCSLIRGLFNNFPQVDWIMGYNQNSGEKAKEYMGCKTDAQSKKWITGMQYWGYIKGASMETLRTSKPEGTRFFKPYLVLNNNLEDDPKHPKKIQITKPDGSEKSIDDPDYTFVSQCRRRVNDAVPGAELWEKVRLKHLSKENRLDAESGKDKHYGELNPGIGFKGLIEEVKQGSVDFETCLAESKNIANRVAQKMGYSDYKSLLFDFTPNGLFSTEDVVHALDDSVPFSDLEKRLPIFYKYGLLEDSNSAYGIEDESIDSNGNVSEDFDEDFFNTPLEPEQNLDSNQPVNQFNNSFSEGHDDAPMDRAHLFGAYNPDEQNISSDDIVAFRNSDGSLQNGSDSTDNSSKFGAYTNNEQVYGKKPVKDSSKPHYSAEQIMKMIEDRYPDEKFSPREIRLMYESVKRQLSSVIDFD